MRVIDPNTGDWPWDPYAGILPIGTPACQQGSVTFTVRPRTDAPTYSVITNYADIVFDANPAIRTNEVWNTLLD